MARVTSEPSVTSFQSFKSRLKKKVETVSGITSEPARFQCNKASLPLANAPFSLSLFFSFNNHLPRRDRVTRAWRG
jgi:hypothetical protein